MTMSTYEDGMFAIKSCSAKLSVTVRENQLKLNRMPSWNSRDTFFVS